MTRLLLNENVPAPTVAILRAEGLDVLAIGEREPGLGDSEVLALARAEDRWLVTFDRDYGELVFARRQAPPPVIVLLRRAHYRPEDPASWIIELLDDPEPLLGRFVVLSSDGVRTRPMLGGG